MTKFNDYITLLGLLLILIISACAESSEQGTQDTLNASQEANGWYGELPVGFPKPFVPLEYKMSPEKIELGRHLFYDSRLSVNQSQSCASCHEQHLAFSDGLSQSMGATGEKTHRNSMALVNVVYNSFFTWANSSLTHLEAQIVIPLFGESPVELGLSNEEDQVLSNLLSDELYQDLFTEAYPQVSEPGFNEIVGALGAFCRSLISGDSNFDRYVYQQQNSLDESALRGLNLFFSEELECHHCHGGFNFSEASTHSANMSSFSGTVSPFHNTGLYNIDNEGAYPLVSQGLFSVTGDPIDIGKFRAPTLRNIALTAPYMHDGSMETLEEVIRFYEAGGRNIIAGPHQGDGRQHPLKSPFISGFTLTDQERTDLIHFLENLSDENFITNPRYSDPWK